MKAARFYAKQDIRVEETDPPKGIAPNQLRILPLWCGICGTDLHEFKAGPIVTPKSPHPLTGAQLPQILGHEFSARVVEIGKHVSGISVGDRVSIMPLCYCGRCYYCRRGQNHLCKTMGCVGLSWQWGGMGDECVVNDYHASVIPEEISDEQGALIEPAAVAVYSVLRAGIQSGDSVLVTGAGPIGSLVVLAAAAAGATRIFVSEPNPVRGELAKSFGVVEAVYDPSSTDVAVELKELTGGIGVDVALECVGFEPALNLCVEAVRSAGTVVQTGLHVGKASVDPMLWALKDLTIAGIWCYPVQIWPRIVSMIASGKFPVEKVITAKIPLSEVVQRGFERLTAKGNDALKVLVTPKEG
jgi:(R,R)-butanediol dehydrogenase / meso-butanediol dehydrogenase / diacetyl reductase